MVNVWRGERRIESDGGEAVIAVTHDGIAAMMDALKVRSANELIMAIATLDVRAIRKAVGACETVSGDPAAVVSGARGAAGLDAIADNLIGMIKGQTPEEQQAEKERLAALEETRAVLAVRSAMAEILREIRETPTRSNG